MKFYNKRYKKFLKANSLVDLLKIQEVTIAGREVGYLTKAEARRQEIAKRKHARAISRGLKSAHREKRRTRALLADLAKKPRPLWMRGPMPRLRATPGGFEGVPAGGLPADVQILCTLDFVAWRATPELMAETGLTQPHVIMTRKRLKKAGLIEMRRCRGWRKVRRDEPRFMLRLTEAGLRYCAALAVLIGDRPRSIEGADVDSELRERIAARRAARRSAGGLRMWAREGHAEKRAIGLARAQADPDVRARHRAAVDRMWADPEYRKRHAEWSRRTYKERKAEADRCLEFGRRDPEVQAKRIAAVRAAHERDPTLGRRQILRVHERSLISEEQRRQISETLKARWLAMTPEQRALQVKGLRSISPKKRSALARKAQRAAVVSRRRNKALRES